MTLKRLTRIFVYPVKSCGGIELSECEVVAGGLLCDRRYMLVDPDGNFITARKEPRLLTIRSDFVDRQDLTKGYVLRAASGPALLLPQSVEGGDPDARCRMVGRVWGDELIGFQWQPGSDWFSRFLEKPVRLLYQPTEALRPVKKRARPADRVSLADGYPLLLCSEESLADLNDRLDHPVPMSRFRPNVVIEGGGPFEEDTWESLAIGEVAFQSPKLCERCVMTTVDASSGTKAKEPLRTLARYRRWDGAVWFGSNLVPRGTGRLRVGDPVGVHELRAPRDSS